MLVSLGVNHKRVSIGLLDRLTIRNPRSFYRSLLGMEGLKGALILQTCNRVEIYFETSDELDLSKTIMSAWAHEAQVGLIELKGVVEKKTDDDAVKHLVRVGSGLESMLVGEPQILQQLKDALTMAESEGATSPRLSDLFEKSIRAAGHVRHETGIGKGTVSLGSAAIRLAEEEIGPVKKANVLIVGTGHVGMLVMKALNARKAERVRVAGRNLEHTILFCRTHGGQPIEFDQVKAHLESTDLLILATRATSPIVTGQFLAPILDTKGHGRLVILDLSTPRNVSPAVEEIEGVTVKTLEDIRGIAEATRARRREIVKHAEPLANQYATDVITLLRRENAEPIVSGIYHQANLVRTRELEKAISRLHLGPEDQKILERMSISLVEKILGPPAGNLRKAAEKGDKQVLTAAGHIFKNN